MCGIVGVTNKSGAPALVLKGLERLEYRGYDSAGIFSIGDGLIKTTSRVASLKNQVCDWKGTTAIGHTRWATHGGVTLENAHPHVCNDGLVTLVHNGVITNYLTLKEELIKAGYHFFSETDTEILTNYISYRYKANKDIKTLLATLLTEVKGELGVAFTIKDQDGIYFIKRGSPLVISRNEDSYFVASDLMAIEEEKNQDWYFPLDGEFGFIYKDSSWIGYKKKIRKIPFTHLDHQLISSSKGRFKHFMKKEIFEEIMVIDRLKDKYFTMGELCFDSTLLETIKSAKRVVMLGAGSSYLALRYIVKSYEGKLPLFANVASEFEPDQSDTVYLLLSQSGETYDLIQTIQKIKRGKVKIILVTNNIFSSLSRLSDFVLDLEAGPEQAVAATKSYIADIVILDLLFKAVRGKKIGKAYFKRLQDSIKSALDSTPRIKRIAKKLTNYSSIYFIGKGIDYEIALEGALKLKEVSYIHAEALQAGELKHGPIATISSSFPVLAIASSNLASFAIDPNIKEIIARKAPVFLFDLKGLKKGPKGLEGLSIAVSLELLSYYTSLYLKRDIDKPRNLAKSVTVI